MQGADTQQQQHTDAGADTQQQRQRGMIKGAGLWGLGCQEATYFRSNKPILYIYNKLGV